MGNTNSFVFEERTKAVWKWKTGDDPWSDKNTEWSSYSDPEIYIIEDAFQKGKSSVELDNYRIDLKRLIQVSKFDGKSQRPIKRVAVDGKNPRVRATERFLHEETGITSKSFSPIGIWGWSKFLAAAGYNARIRDEDLPNRLEAAATGIEQEGKLLNSERIAETLAKALRGLKKKRPNEIGKGCIRIYTMESFLYKLINRVMRETQIVEKPIGSAQYSFVSEDGKKYGRTLGPYCSLVLSYLWQNLSHEEVTVYRAVNLEPPMIEDYKKHIPLFVEWDSFSSTTISLDKAKRLKTNCIFRIKIPRGPHPSLDIHEYSEYPDEEEVLLPAGTWVKIVDVTDDHDLGVTIIDFVK